MNIELHYDCETTGIPDWKIPSSDASQPHLVQLAAILCNADTHEVIQTFDVIIKPIGWVIPDDCIAVHGITNEKAHAVGIPEDLAIELLISLCGDADRVAYNKTFDQRIIRIGLMRYGFSEEIIEKWAQKDNHHCAMRMAQKVLGGKNPKLAAAYKHFTGEELISAHSAMADTEACMKVYYAIKAAQSETKAAVA